MFPDPASLIGKLVRLRPGLVVCLYERTRYGYYGCVVYNTHNDAYPVGGYHILVFEADAVAAPIVDIKALLPTPFSP